MPDSLQVVVIASIGVYFLAMLALGWQSHKAHAREEFIIGNRDVGYLPTVGSLSASFRDGMGIVLWIGFGLTIGYGGLWMIIGGMAGLVVCSIFGPSVRTRAIEQGAITVGELIRSTVGPITEKTTAIIVLIFSLVVISIQLYISGNLFAEVIDFASWIGIFSVVVGTYLLLGGYGNVIKTDQIQFFLIISIIALPFFVDLSDKRMLDLSSLFMPPAVDMFAMFLLGFFYVLSSGDVWQKMFSARNEQVIKIGFPVSGVCLLLMTLGLIWLGMASKELLAGEIAQHSGLYELFGQQVLPIWLLAFLAVMIMAITMSTLDTFCYLFASSLAKNIIPEKLTKEQDDYIRISKLIMATVLIVAASLALTISDVIQFLFKGASLMFILVPLYLLVGFGRNTGHKKLDTRLSVAVAISVAVYVILFARGDFTNMIMLVVPVAINSILIMAILFVDLRLNKNLLHNSR